MTNNTDIGQDSIGQLDAGQASDNMLPGSDISTKGIAPKAPLTTAPSIFISKKTLLLIMILAIAAISVGAVTVSLFGADQHDWVDPSAVDCTTCHTDVEQEFTDMLATGPSEPHEAMDCVDCHQNTTAEFDDQHGAVLPNCTSCHTTVATNMSYDTEAHKDLFDDASATGWGKGPNEACVVCHTGFDVSTTFERPDYYNFSIDFTYSITNVDTSSSTHSNTYTWAKTGEVHTYLSGADVTCADGVAGCHNDIITARGGISGGHHTATQPSDTTHLMNTLCDSCHVDSQEVADTNYHAAKNISCAYRLNGCHDRGDTHVSANMTTIFSEINSATDMTFQKEGDICWGCHNGYNWIDPPAGGAGGHTWANYTTSLDVVDAANHGNVAGTEANTHGAGAQTIQEVLSGGASVYNNYTVTADTVNAGNHGTVTNSYTNVDELPPVSDGLTETITEVTTGGDVWANYTVASDIPVEGTVTNTYTNIDENPATGDVESIQEVAGGGVGGDAFANAVGGTDNTADVLADIQSDNAAGNSPTIVAANDGWYTVDKNRILFMDGFNTGGMSGTVTGATLEVQYSVESGYNGNNPVTWALNGGGLASTGITPANGQTDTIATYDLFAQGVTTLAQIATLDVGFVSNDGGPADAVSFDYIKIIVTTAGGAPSLEHKWTTNNIPAGYSALNLYVRGLSSAPADDVFSVFWSNDDVTYTDTGININNAAMTTYAPYTLPLGESGVLYIQVIDDNTGDVALTTCQIDTIRLEWYEAIPVVASLEHRWTTQNIPAGASTLTLFIDARFNTGSDDTFTFEWSTDDVTYNPTTITINSDTMSTYSWNFPGATSGVLYLRVADSNSGDSQADSLIVDIIRIQHVVVGGGSYSLEHRWQTQALPAGADDLTLLVNGSHNAGSDDTFTIEYSTDNLVYTPTTITINSNVLTAYSAALPVMSGQIYLRVVDDTNGEAVQQDTVSIDEIHIMWHDFTPAGGSELTIQVWTEPSNTVNVWNDTTLAFEQVYPRVVSSCADCHYDTGTDPVPFGSGKYVNHLNDGSSNYDYTHCEDCHDTATEPWYPHDIPHAIEIDWTTYASAADTNVDNDFCNVICHYSDLDSRPIYQDASTPWMQDIYTSFTNDGAKHTNSAYIDADGTVECVDCHPDHLQRPIDTDDGAQLFGGSSLQGCGDQDLGVGGCHLVANGVVDGAAIDDRETPASHGTSTSWVVSGRDDCTESGCHDKHNYPLVPSEGHNPVANCHPGGITCGSNTNSHAKHIAADWGIPDYQYNCSQCHFNAAGDLDGWYDNTYGTPEHNDGNIQVRFNVTAPSTSGIATYANGLAPTFNGTGNMECSNTYCHSDGYVPGFSWNAADPEWDTPGVACGDCHDMAPTTSSHQKHCDGSSYQFECSECHYVAGEDGAGSGYYDTTYGTIQHVDGQVQVNFNTSALGIASFGGASTPAFNGDDTCDNVYCHSDGHDTDGSAPWTFTYYTAPAWGVGTVVCGDCHGVPGLATNELNTNAHEKHVRNYGGIYASRNLVWFDDVVGTHSYPDAGEAVMEDDGDFFLDPGLLNVAPDVLLTPGTAGLTDFVAGDNIFWNDNGNGGWDIGEDIWYDAGGNGASFDAPADWRLYNGGANDAGIGGGDPNVANEDDQSLMYLNTDQDDNYYSFMHQPGGSYPATYYYSGTEEPIINIGNLGGAGAATGSNLLPTYEVLQPFQGDGTYPSIGYWFDDMQAWYDYDCSECHYNTPPTAGYGTYETSLHVDMNIDVFTSGDPAGVSTYFGAYTPSYMPATMECGTVYCHSDGNFQGATNDGNPDFAGPGDDTAFHEIYPDWNDPSTVSCGAAETSCHFAGDEDSTMAAAEHPNTNSHRRGAHVDADNSAWKGGGYDTWCFLCHFDDFSNLNTLYYHPYGMPTHVDGDLLIDSAAAQWSNPIVGAGRGDPCHNSAGAWSGSYGGTGC